MSEKQFVYIAGPYRAGNVATNIANVIRAAESVAAAGHIPFAPHLNHLWSFLYPHEHEYWMRLDLAWLTKCSCLIRLPGESPGATEEVLRARELRIPVYRSVEEFLGAVGVVAKAETGTSSRSVTCNPDG